MNIEYLYLQIYRIFDRTTPLKIDCGALCGKLCCQGDDSGMYLFPGEKRVYDLLNPDWLSLEKADFTYSHNGKEKHLWLAACKGDCDRYQRPLACRIFPLTPYLNNGVLEIIIDPRAKAICPLAKTFYMNEFEQSFVKSVKSAFVLLCKNPEFMSFMKEYSAYLDDYLKFYK